ncbi:hypothetical protein CLOM_g23910 [Closterium sp. NIES-68]|nr:hypothetical protein CLOM_g23910 [Closterium sp. NIES-68]GJP58730.1 hypothetical protein CLOP_g3314 [Closterium sp. NIES-67]
MRSFNGAAHACMRAKRVERAVRLLRQAEREGLAPTAATFALLIQAAGHLRRAAMVEDTLRTMQHRGFPYDAVTYRCAVYALVRCGEGGRALEALQEMVTAGHPPAMTVPDVLIKSVDGALLLECTRAAPGGNLRQFLREMRGAGLMPTASTSAHLVQLLASSHSPSHALDAAHELAAAGVGQLGDATWHAIGQAVWQDSNHNPQEAAVAAQRLLAAVEADGCTVSRELHEVAIAVHVRSGDGAAAMRLHRLMEAAHAALPAAHGVALAVEASSPPLAHASHASPSAPLGGTLALLPACQGGASVRGDGGAAEGGRGREFVRGGDGAVLNGSGCEAWLQVEGGGGRHDGGDGARARGMGEEDGREVAEDGVVRAHGGLPLVPASATATTPPEEPKELSRHSHKRGGRREHTDARSIAVRGSDGNSEGGGSSGVVDCSADRMFLEAIDAALTHALAQVCPPPLWVYPLIPLDCFFRFSLQHRSGSFRVFCLPLPWSLSAPCLVASAAQDISRAPPAAAPPHYSSSSTGSGLGNVSRREGGAGSGGGKHGGSREGWTGNGANFNGAGRMGRGGKGTAFLDEETAAGKGKIEVDASGVSGLVADFAASGIRVKPRAVQSAIRHLMQHEDDQGAGDPMVAATPARPSEALSLEPTAIPIRRPAAAVAGKESMVVRGESSGDDAEWMGSSGSRASSGSSDNSGSSGGVGSGGGAGGGEEGVPWLDRAISLVDALPRLFSQQPTAYVYAELLSACVRKRQWRQGEQLWQQMGAAGVQADVACWQARLRCLGALSRVGGNTHSLLAEAAAAGTGMERHPELLRVLLRECQRANDGDGAAFVRNMLAMSQRNS